MDEAIKCFKVLQLICKNFNGSYALTVIPALKYVGAFLGMACFIVAVRAKAVPGINYVMLLCAVVIFGGTTFLVCGISAVWKFSIELLAWGKESLGSIKSKEKMIYLSKILKSLSPHRVSVDGKYYMEKAAKLTFIHFVVTGCVNLLLLIK